MKKLLFGLLVSLLWSSAFPQRDVPSGCSIITISMGGSVFFGGNYDYINPDSYYWVENGNSSKYGVIWIGLPDNPQQGINEKGLAYDANGLPRFEVNPHNERIPVKGEYYHNYIMQIMHECSTVTEVIEWANRHQRFPNMHDQMHFADKTGDAVVISAGKDGEMVFTRKTPGDGFLVSTNFNVADPANDIDENALKYLESRCKKNNMTNVETFPGKVDHPMLPAGKADIAFMISTYHHLEEPVEMMRNTIPALNKDGILIIVERDPVKTGQTGRESTTVEKLISDADKAGFELVKVNKELLERDNVYFFYQRNEPDRENNTENFFCCLIVQPVIRRY